MKQCKSTKQLWSSAFHVKASQSAKTSFDPEKMKIGPKSNRFPFGTGAGLTFELNYCSFKCWSVYKGTVT